MSQNRFKELENTEDANKIAVVGATGTLGRIASEGLDTIGHEVVPVDIDSEVERVGGYSMDLSEEFDELVQNGAQKLSDCEVILNYGWNTADEKFTVRDTAPENKKVAENVYKLARECDIPLVVQASSIHAGSLPAHASVVGAESVDQMLERTEEPHRTTIEERVSDPSETVSVDRASPDSPYGASKLNIEALGQYHADPDVQNSETTHFDEPLEAVVAIRYGGVNPQNEVEPFMEDEPLYDTVWMSHEDVVRQLDAIINSDSHGFHRSYGISDNDGNPYSLQNPFQYEPKDNASKLLKRN